MKKYLKIFIAWLLLTVLFYNFGFSFILFEISIRINRNSIEKYFSDTDESQLQVLKISDQSSIIRIKNFEIIFEGKSYDVKKEYLKNGITYFYCFHDEKEDKLNTAIIETVKNNSDIQSHSQKGHTIDLIKQLTKFFFNEKSLIVVQESINSCRIFANNDSFLSHNYFSIITPPPKKIFSC